MFTEEILNGKLHFLCSAPIEKANAEADMDSQMILMMALYTSCQGAF